MLTTVTWNNLPKWLRAKAKRLGDDPWSKHGSPNRPFPYLPSQKLKGSDSSMAAQSVQSAPQDMRGVVLLAMMAEGQLNDETLPADRMAIFKTKPFQEWPKDLQDKLAPFGAAMIR